SDGQSMAFVHYKKGQAILKVHRDTVEDHSFYARTFLLLPVVELLRTRGFVYVHGALATQNENSILFLGRGGSGKSTLVSSLLTKEYKLVADDNLLFKISPEGACQGYPFEQELGLHDSAFEQLHEPSRPYRDDQKWRVPLYSFRREAIAPFANPRKIILLQ